MKVYRPLLTGRYVSVRRELAIRYDQGTGARQGSFPSVRERLALIIHEGRWLPRGVRRIAATAEILASGYDCGPTGGPGAGVPQAPEVPSVGRRDRSVLVSRCPAVRRSVASPGDRLGSWPVRGDLPVASPPAADQAGGGVQDPVAQRLGLGPGEVAVEGEELERRAGSARSWPRSVRPG